MTSQGMGDSISTLTLEDRDGASEAKPLLVENASYSGLDTGTKEIASPTGRCVECQQIRPSRQKVQRHEVQYLKHTFQLTTSNTNRMDCDLCNVLFPYPKTTYSPISRHNEI